MINSMITGIKVYFLPYHWLCNCKPALEMKKKPPKSICPPFRALKFIPFELPSRSSKKNRQRYPE